MYLLDCQTTRIVSRLVGYIKEILLYIPYILYILSYCIYPYGFGISDKCLVVSIKITKLRLQFLTANATEKRLHEGAAVFEGAL